MKKLISLLTMLLCSLTIYPQSNTNSLTGNVKEKGTLQIVEQASVVLLRTKDSTMVQGTVTNSKGQFTIENIKAGKYILRASFVGFETYYKNIAISDKKESMNMGNILLSYNSIALKEAVVQGKAPEVVVKQDTVEYNAASYKTQPNSVVEDLVKKLPGVEVDANGKITAGGKEVKKILVDGKEFFGNDPKVASKNIPVDIVDKLQVVDRKSDLTRLTGVDDGEDEKVINLTIKKGMKKGLFGNVSAGVGNKDRYEMNGMINRFIDDDQFTLLGGANNTNNQGFTDSGDRMYSGSSFRRNRGGQNSGINTSNSLGANLNVGNKDIFRVGGDLSFSNSNINQSTKSHRENLLQGGSTFSNSGDTATTKSQNFSMNLKLEWKIDSLSKFEFAPSFSYNKTDVVDFGNFSTLNSNNQFINKGQTANVSHSKGLNYSGRVSFSRESKQKKGRRLSFSLDYDGSDTEGYGTNFSHTNYLLNDSTAMIDQWIDENNRTNGYRLYATYVEPILKNRFLMFTYTYRKNNSNADKYAYKDSLKTAGNIDIDYSNSFRNYFETQQFNMSFKTVRDKYNYTVGVNLNPSYSKSVNLMDSLRSVPARTVLNYSPSLNFVYLFSRNNSLRVDYRGQTRQPSITQLQPVKSTTNQNTIQLGNPELNPSYNNSFSVRYVNYVPEKQQSLMAFLSVNATINSIVNETYYDKENGKQTIMPVNVNGIWDASGMFMYSSPLKNKKFQINSYTNINFRNTIGISNKEKNTSKTLGATESFGFSYRSDLFDTGLNGNYSVSRTINTLTGKQNQTIMNYGGTFNTSIYLPFNFTIGSDMNYSANAGYSNNFKTSQWLWNAQITYSFLKSKQASVMFKVYDILQQRSNVTRSVTGNYIEDAQYNTLTSYGMLTFTYKINTMGGRKGGSKNNSSTDENRERPRHMQGGERRMHMY